MKIAKKNISKVKKSVKPSKGKLVKVTKKLKEKKLPKSGVMPVTNGSAAVKKKVEKTSKNKEKSKNAHQKDLDCLKEIDPEFYDFLKKNDKQLLEFNLYDDSDEDTDMKNEESIKNNNNEEQENSSEDDEDDEKMSESDVKEELYHKPAGELEVASDESDFENDEEDTLDGDGLQKITLNLLRQWQLRLENAQVSIDVIRKAIQAFNSALASISADTDDARGTNSTLKVEGAAAFNGVVQLCVLYLQPALIKYLGITKKTTTPLHKNKKWPKVRSCLRYYLTDLIRLIENVSSSNILTILLKHLHQMSAMVVPFSHLGKNILKRLIVLWSSADETVRVLSFLCILKITRNQQGTMLNHVLKAMYLSYVRNSKFVSPNTLPAINFMRRSLVEMFALDLNTSYQQAFLYIRQLAIHLRNAVILKKKDSFQAVYNWQYVNSLRLWADLLASTSNKAQLQPLIYPYVTIAIGVIRLIPTAQYFPLRFHCLQSLITLAKGANTFIPVLPLILEVLRSNTFNQKHTSVSMKPLQFTCILRLNKAQLAENGFRDEVIEQVFALSLEYLTHESASLAFSDLVVPAVIALKAYLKQCNNANYSRKIKQLLDKILENSNFVEQERRKINFGLKDLKQVQAWETLLHNKGTPLDIYYNSWLKTHETKKRRQAAQSDTINDGYNIPVITKSNKKSVHIERNEKGDVELFPSDTEEEEGNQLSDAEKVEDVNLQRKSKKKLKKGKKPKKTKRTAVEHTQEEFDVPVEEADPEEVDIVKDLDLNDW